MRTVVGTTKKVSPSARKEMVTPVILPLPSSVKCSSGWERPIPSREITTVPSGSFQLPSGFRKLAVSGS